MKRSTLFALAGAIVAVLAAGYLLRDRIGGWFGPDASTPSRPPPVVEVQLAEPRQVATELTATGTLQPPEAVMLTTERAGRVARILFEEGAPASAGEVLLELDAGRERARIDEAQARVSEAERALRRARELRDDDYVAEAGIDEAETALADARAALAVAREDLADMRITAPFDGITGRRLVSPGALVEPGTSITQLVITDALDVLFEIPGVNIAALEPGMPVTARSRAWPGRDFPGEVTFIAPEVDAATRSLPLEARIDNGSGDLRPGMFVDVTLETGRRDALAVPEGALILRGPATFLFVLGDDGVVQRRAVETGVRRSGWVEISDGLEAGERVIVSGIQKVRDGQPARTDTA